MDDIRKNVKNAYDSIADDYHTQTDEYTVPKSQKNIEQKFVSTLSKNDIILDAGCGGKPIQINGVETIGLDFSRGQLTKNKKDIETIQGDMTNIPCKMNYFNGLTAFYSLIHIPLQYHQDVLHEFARVLKKNSYLLITEGTEKWKGSNPSWLDTEKEMSWEMAGKNKTREQLKNAGFKISKIQPVKDTLGDEEGTKIFFLAKLVK